MTLRFARAFLLAALPLAAAAQTPAPPATEHPYPSFDTGVMDTTANPCNDFYRFACGNFAKLHPIPPDQQSTGSLRNLLNVNTERLHTILDQYSAPNPARTPNQQKIGDFYAACMDTTAIQKRGLAPIQPLLSEIDRVSKPGLPYFAGELQRFGVPVLFNFGSQPSLDDSTHMIGSLGQGGLGLPDRDYYTRTGDADKKLRDAYVHHIAHMLFLLGTPQDRADAEADAVLKFETTLANASLTNVELRDPVATWHPMTVADFGTNLVPGAPFSAYFEAVHTPPLPAGKPVLTVDNPKFFPTLISAILNTDLDTLHASLRYHLLTTFAPELPQDFDDENFHFYGTVLTGQPQQRARWKRCSEQVDNALGEALGQIYVAQYFSPAAKTRTLEEVNDIEAAMGRDIDSLEWMSPETRVRAHQKLALITNKIGYPDRWRDYSTLSVAPNDPVGNLRRANAFENDRQLAKIGQPVDRSEWFMTPPTVNAYYDPTQNNINFPAGILQPNLYDPSADLAVNYGHIGAVVGHELTHGFDDQGSQFDGHGNLVDWWTPADKQRFQARTACIVNQYSAQVVAGLHLNGKLTLGEDTADNGGLLLAYLAYLDRAQKSGIDPQAKIDGYTGPQRFYIAFAQNWCAAQRPEALRQQIQTNPHSPSQIRATEPILNQPAFGAAFSCPANSPMTPTQNCRVW